MSLPNPSVNELTPEEDLAMLKAKKTALIVVKKRGSFLDAISNWFFTVIILLMVMLIGVQIGLAQCKCAKRVWFSDSLILGADQ